MDASNEWVREHGLLVAIIGIAYLIARDALRSLWGRLRRDEELTNASLLSQKADFAINLAEQNNRRLAELRDEMARLVRRGEK